MVARLIFLTCVAACLYLPLLTDFWGHYGAVFLAYGGMPLAIASAAHASVGADLLPKRPASLFLAASWALGCVVTCFPTLGIAAPVAQARAGGAALVVAAAGLLIAAVRAVLFDGQASRLVKGLYGSAILLFGGAFLWNGLLLASSATGSAFAWGLRKDEAFRIAVLAGAGLVVVAAVSSAAERRPTRA